MATYGLCIVRSVVVVLLVLAAIVVWRRAVRRRREAARRARLAQMAERELAAPPMQAIPAEPGADADPASAPVVEFRGGSVSEGQVVAALRECFDPEIPIDIYELGLVYGVDIDADAIAVRMTLTSRDCPSARTIPEDVKRRIVALGQPNVSVEVVWEPAWHPSRISAAGKQRLGLG